MTELVQSTETKTLGFIAGRECSGNENWRCAVRVDKKANDCIGKMMDEDGIVLSLPMYFAEVLLIPSFRQSTT